MAAVLKNGRHAIAGILLATTFLSPLSFAADAPPLTIEFLGPPGPSSFPRLLSIKLVNEKFVNVDLSAVVASLRLAIDGKLVPDPHWPVLATVPIAPLDSRDVCVSADDGLPPLTPGPHTIQIQTGAAFGPLRSNLLSFTWSGPKQDPSPDLHVWHKEIRKLADRMDKGVSRSCVDLWLPTRDGGEQSPRVRRYYLGAGVKIDVPFDDRGGADSLENVVKGKVRIYQENRIAD